METKHILSTVILIIIALGVVQVYDGFVVKEEFATDFTDDNFFQDLDNTKDNSLITKEIGEITKKPTTEKRTTPSQTPTRYLEPSTKQKEQARTSAIQQKETSTKPQTDESFDLYGKFTSPFKKASRVGQQVDEVVYNFVTAVMKIVTIPWIGGFGNKEDITDSGELEDDSFSEVLSGTAMDMIAASAEPIRAFYIAQLEQGASNQNDGLYPTYQGDFKGPWLSFEAANVQKNPNFDGLQPGDTLYIRRGNYELTRSEWRLPLSAEGTVDKPVTFSGYNGEKVVIDAGFTPDQLNNVISNPGDYEAPLMQINGKNIIVKDITLTGCYLVCMLVHEASNVVVKNVVFEGSLEDAIKTTVGSENFEVIDSTFTGFSNEAIDFFGLQGGGVYNSVFKDNYLYPGQRASAAIWTKGGATDISIRHNEFHNLDVELHAVIAGGCCWNHWDWEAWSNGSGKPPVAKRTLIQGNRFYNTKFSGLPTWTGVIGVSACEDCTVNNNFIETADVAIGIHPTQSGSEKAFPKNTRISNNYVQDLNTRRTMNIQSGTEEGLVIENNRYCGDEPYIWYAGSEMDWESFKALGYDHGSRRC